MTKKTAPFSVMREIRSFNRDRKPRLVRLKYARMAENPFAFFRGTDHLFARHWLRLKPAEEGPAILISGDLHLENFGGYAADDGIYVYDINDFDEALVAPCSLDLVRCAASILLACDLWQIRPVQASAIALVYLDRYRDALLEFVRNGEIGEVAWGNGKGAIWDLLGKTALASSTALLDRFTTLDKKGHRRLIAQDDRFPRISDKRADIIRKAVEKYGRQIKAKRAFRVLDIARRVAGTGSLGLRRYVVLARGDGKPDQNLIWDIKEARPSSLLPCTDQRQPDMGGDEALRVVTAQRQLQGRPTRGLDVITIDDDTYRIRELVPDENRSRLDRLQKQPDKLRNAVAVAGQLTAWSQLRGSVLPPADRTSALVRWASGPALDAVLVAAVRYADQTIQDFRLFLASVEA